MWKYTPRSSKPEMVDVSATHCLVREVMKLGERERERVGEIEREWEGERERERESLCVLVWERGREIWWEEGREERERERERESWIGSDTDRSQLGQGRLDQIRPNCITVRITVSTIRTYTYSTSNTAHHVISYHVLSCLYTTTGMPVRINNPDDFVYDSVIDGVSGLKLLRVFSMPLKVSTVCTARTVHLLLVIRRSTHCLTYSLSLCLYLSIFLSL